MMRRHLAMAAAALVTVGMAALPTSAATFADVGTCTLVAGELRCTADAGVANEVEIRQDGVRFVVEDNAGEVVAGTGCTAAGSNATVPAAQVTRVRVLLGDGDDSADVNVQRRAVIRGGAGDDTARGGGGADDVRGGNGNDDLNGGPGTDDCNGGLGTDTEAGCEP
ncbi:calcium-binding protein [Nonomuraea harbinensis]|uniref:Calcium-binding protein n=1 Tax=Nonomuraea harbinensis TaxID=1286938 RepID=A0ABW1BQF6_9ACTN|nr:hypothetical protein [Nonomuraea harbinensis]